MYQINVDSKARGHSRDALIHPNNKMFEMAQTHVNIFICILIGFFLNKSIPSIANERLATIFI